MPNRSQLKQGRMLAFLQKIKDEHRDDDNVLNIHQFMADQADRLIGMALEQRNRIGFCI